MSCIFVHAGAGYHSKENERLHLAACEEYVWDIGPLMLLLIDDTDIFSACKAGMLILKNGGSAVDAVEMAIKILEDREITNAGYGSNPNVDGVVECDAIVVDHMSRSGAVGAVARELHSSETFAQYLRITDVLQKLGILYLSHESCWIVLLSHCRYAEYLQICWSARGPQTLLMNMASRSYHSPISCHQPQNNAGRNGVQSLCVQSAVMATDRHLRRRMMWNVI
jgi:hypothetical protein